MTFGSGIASLAAAIDGKHARTLKETKMVVNPETLRVMYGLLASNTAVTLPDYFMMNTGGIMTTSEHAGHGLDHREGHRLQDRTPACMYNGIAKMWGGGIQVIRDEFSKAPETSSSSRRTSTPTTMSSGPPATCKSSSRSRNWEG